MAVKGMQWLEQGLLLRHVGGPRTSLIEQLI